MPESIFASKTVVGERYITKGGWPVTVLEVGVSYYGKKGVKVRNDSTGDKTCIFENQLLWPYSAERISKEAIDMAKTSKEKGAGKPAKVKTDRGSCRGARKEKEGIVLFRVIGGVERQALVHDGIVTVNGKDHMTVKQAAEAMIGGSISGSGRSFFGLRTTGNIELGKEVWKQLKAAEEAKAAVEKKPKKAKAKKAKDDEDEDDSGPSPKSVGELVAKVMGRGRK